MNDTITAIVSDRYRVEQRQLRRDPIILAMAEELARDIQEGQVANADGTLAFRNVMIANGWEATFTFMRAASHRYAQQGGQAGFSIGGPSEAVLALVRESIEQGKDQAS